MDIVLYSAEDGAVQLEVQNEEADYNQETRCDPGMPHHE